MKVTSADWQALRFPLLGLLGTLLLSAGLLYFSQYELAQARTFRDKQKGALQEARNRLHQSGDEKNTILRHRAEFMALQQQGFIGDEQRINWIDALRAASLHLKMFGISYQIEAQQPYTSPMTVEAGEYRLRQSVMKITMDLLHEEDLVHFMHTLEDQGAGIFALKQCDLQRLGFEKAGNVRVQPHLKADCSLAWLTIAKEKGEEQP